MTDNFNACLKEILLWEGGYSNHPQDKGGATNHGVTQQTYEHWVGRKVTIDEMKALTADMVKPIYRKMFWDAMKCAALPYGLDLCVFDFGVNAGVNRSTKLLQKVVGTTQDGVIGPTTIRFVTAFVNKVGVENLIEVFQDQRRRYYRQLSTFNVFGRGWLRRVDDIQMKAIKMAGAK